MSKLAKRRPSEVITKNYILNEIQRTAQENDGIALGRRSFLSETGIRESVWFGKYWVRWGDAVREAGLLPNDFHKKALSDEQLLEKLLALIKEIGHYPTKGELRIKKSGDPAFPDDRLFHRGFGRRHVLIQRLLEYCRTRGGYEDVLEICRPIAASSEEISDFAPQRQFEDIGSVYLMRSGRHYKIGCTNAVGRRERELAIQLPEKALLVHHIKTDDPAGIEAYWHRRFQGQRKNGEWFALTPQDVSVFRRRKFM